MKIVRSAIAKPTDRTAIALNGMTPTVALSATKVVQERQYENTGRSV
jgi:hypothetical protein